MGIWSLRFKKAKELVLGFRNWEGKAILHQNCLGNRLTMVVSGMILGQRFDPDRNQVLQDTQYKLYGELLAWLYACPRQRYLSAVALVGQETELAVLVRKREGFDHRVLQTAHDKIAAYYRYAHDSGGQMVLPFNGLSHEQRLERDWKEYWHSEVARLTEQDNEFVLAVLAAVAYQNTSTGYEAEDMLIGHLNAVYGVAWDLDYCAPTRKSSRVHQTGDAGVAVDR